MNKLTEDTKAEIVEYFTAKERWSEEYCMGQNDTKCDVTETDTEVCVRVSKMYNDGIGHLASFTNMQWLSNLLGTDRINVGDRDYRSGCDSCDYGSEESLVLTAYK